MEGHLTKGDRREQGGACLFNLNSIALMDSLSFLSRWIYFRLGSFVGSSGASARAGLQWAAEGELGIRIGIGLGDRDMDRPRG